MRGSVGAFHLKSTSAKKGNPTLTASTPGTRRALGLLSDKYQDMHINIQLIQFTMFFSYSEIFHNYYMLITIC